MVLLLDEVGVRGVLIVHLFVVAVVVVVRVLLVVVAADGTGEPALGEDLHQLRLAARDDDGRPLDRLDVVGECVGLEAREAELDAPKHTEHGAEGLDLPVGEVGLVERLLVGRQLGPLVRALGEGVGGTGFEAVLVGLDGVEPIGVFLGAGAGQTGGIGLRHGASWG